jgi:hypothetical protein
MLNEDKRPKLIAVHQPTFLRLKRLGYGSTTSMNDIIETLLTEGEQRILQARIEELKNISNENKK